MSSIRDEVKRDVPSRPHVARSQADIQRIRLEKLMKNPDKPVMIPEKPKERGPPVVPDFVRNVMGSSAGAGSGEFHVYRHLRRKEYARQHYMHKRAEWEKLEDDYHGKIDENKRKAEEETAKKRAKRLKKKQNRKNAVSTPKKVDDSSNESESDEDNDDNIQEDAVKTNDLDQAVPIQNGEIDDEESIRFEKAIGKTCDTIEESSNTVSGT